MKYSSVVKSVASKVLYLMNKNKLTILCYHRINDTSSSDFDTFKPNVSATKEDFAAQIDYLRDHFNIITLDQLTNWVINGKPDLPDHPALITFDDGYQDNYVNAFPILRERRVPAVIFLATDYIGNANPFIWDMVAYCFSHTKYDSAELPIIGLQSWQNASQKDLLIKNWINELKYRPNIELRNAIQQLPDILDVSIPDDAFSNLYLSWDEVREMHNNGVYMGAHTMSHPILTRISLDEVEQELRGSRERIETELNSPVSSLAYPNGQIPDFNSDIERVTQDIGYSTAFSLVNGFPSLQELRDNPFAIRRIFIGQKDTFDRFVMKVSGFRKPTLSF